MRTLASPLRRRATRLLGSAAVVVLAGTVAERAGACSYPTSGSSSDNVISTNPFTPCSIPPNSFYQSGPNLPTVIPPIILTVPYSGFVFFAWQGGSISAPSGTLSITSTITPNAYYVGAYGVWSDQIGPNGAPSQINLGAATTVNTTLDQAYGLYASDGGMISSTNAASSVTTKGNNAYGLYASGRSTTPISVASLISAPNGIAVRTQGSNAVGAQADAGGVLTLGGGSISTQGQGAHALFVSGSGSQANLGGAESLSTQGGGAIALYAANGGVITATGPVMVNTMGGVLSTTLGLVGAFGVEADGAGSQMNLDKVTVTTSGAGATALVATGGGTIASSNAASSVATTGDNADSLYSTGKGSSIAAPNGIAVTTNGSNAVGAQADAGGVLTLGGGSISTQGQGAHALFVSGSGSQANLGGAESLSTHGDGAIALYAAKGGVTTATGPVTINTSGGVLSTALGPVGAFGVNADGRGSQINLGAATITTSGAGAIGLLAGDAASSGSAGSITATGKLSITTANATAAVALQGNGASIIATGGGSIVSAGNAIEFLGGNSQTATFDNFAIANQSGDLIYADPSTATVNFNNTVANAGSGALLNATGGSFVTLNANASTLTGTIQTDAVSKTAVNVTNGSTWTMTGSSTVSTLAVTNSVVVFAPPGSGGGFKTLTLSNYSGSGANITMNAALNGGSGDQIVISGGKATGQTLLSINNVGGSGTPMTIPLVVTNNGGTTNSNAFALAGANTLVVGNYSYRLEYQQSNQDWLLVPTPLPPQSDIANSVTNLARSIQQQIITGRVLQSILLGATEQVNCSNCSSGFGSIGSYAIGAHGRRSLTDELTVMGGFSYDEYSASGVTVTNAPTFAASLVYDPVNFGRSRPFVEVGGGVVPFEQVKYSRSYQNGLTPSAGEGQGLDRSLGLFGRVGWVDRFSPIDEAAVYTDISRSWLSAGGYTETSTAVNPFPATVKSGIDTLNVARLGGQYTHLFNGQFEVNVSAAVAYGFGAGIGSQWDIYGFGPVAPYPIANSTWCEWGARVGYRIANRMVIDAFALGTVGGDVGTTFHGGIGLRYMF